jgi:hypothetical protein
VETPEYAAFARRILKANARRVTTGDIESLTLLAELADIIDTSIRYAVTGCESAATPGSRSVSPVVAPPGVGNAVGDTTVVWHCVQSPSH